METSLMSESVVNAGDVEESVTQVLTHFVQGGGEQVAMSVQLLQGQVEIDLGYDQGSLNKCHNFLRHTLRDLFGATTRFSDYFSVTGPIFFDFFGAQARFFVSSQFLSFCLTYYQP
jgi:hypothetical protein